MKDKAPSVEVSVLEVAAVTSGFRAKFDYIVLKPLWFFLLVQAANNLFQGSWLIALFLVFMALSVGFVGVSLHKTLSYSDLAAGNPSLSDAMRLDSSTANQDDFRAISKSSFGASLIIGITAAVLLVHYDHGWLYAILLGSGIFWLGAFTISALYGLIAHQYVVGRIRSIAFGVVAFWSGICAVVVIVTLAIRAFAHTGMM